MTRTRLSTKRQPRRGFTLIELLVVISIIAVLVSLIAPAVQSARRAARKLECLNNMRNVGLAMQNFQSTAGSLPYLTTDIPNGIGGYIYGAGWTIPLLPALDSTAILKNIKAYASTNGTTSGDATSVIVQQTEQIWLPFYTCPDDNDSFKRPGGLSFVVNSGFISSQIWGSESAVIIAGYNPSTSGYSPATTGSIHQPYFIDWTGNGNFSLDGHVSSGTTFDATDQAVEVATGVFFRATAAPQSNSFQPTLDYVSTGDGTSTTLMISENLIAGPWYGSTDMGPTTASFGVNYIGFGINIPTANNVPQAGLFNSGTLFEIASAYNNPTTNTTLGGTFSNWGINSFLTNASLGSQPRPSSQHAGGVNVIMCDGSGKFIGESIDHIVYTKLVTSNGVTYGEATLNSRDY